MAYLGISWPEHDVADRLIRPATHIPACAPFPNHLARETKQVAVKFFAVSKKNLDMRLTFVESVLECRGWERGEPEEEWFGPFCSGTGRKEQPRPLLQGITLAADPEGP